MTVSCMSTTQVRLQKHLAHISWIVSLVAPDSVDSTSTTPRSTIWRHALTSTLMLQIVVDTISLVRLSSDLVEAQSTCSTWGLTSETRAAGS